MTALDAHAVVPQRNPDLPRLTALRFFAALVVVTVHLAYAIDLFGRKPVAVDVLLPGASVVSFFFMMSGFVLMWSCRHQPRARFWRDRAARLFPLHAVIFTFGVAFAVSIGRAIDLRWGLELVLLQAWVPTWGPFRAQTSPIAASWSLSGELFFYALAPLVFLWAPRLGHRARRAVIGLLVAAVVALPAISDAGLLHFVSVYQLPILRLPEFLIGGLLALEIESGRLRRVPLLPGIVAAAAGWLLAPHLFVAYSYAACTLVGWMLIMVTCAQRDVSGTGSWLHHPVMQSLGRWTFALYLSHGLLLKVTHRILDTRFGVDVSTAGMGWVVAFAVFAFPASFALAGVLHLGVEQPLNRALRGRKKPTRPPVLPEVLPAG